MLGAERESNTINLTDTAELLAYVFKADDTAVPAAELSGVQFTIKKPDETSTTVAGSIQSDGSGFLRYTATDQVGLYVWTAQFTFVSGEKRTYRDEFHVSDPMETPPETRASTIAKEVWFKLEDCFDSEQGGPWLRDMTLSWFEPSKIEHMLPQGLLLVNSWPPMTTLDLSFFTTEVVSTDPALPAGTMEPNPSQYIIVQATLLATIKHLMRSYVEQPQPEGANIVWQNRRDYLQRWQSIYEIEERSFKEIIALWKRQFYNFGQGSMLIGVKAGRLVGTNVRARNVARGWW